jgi:F-type H+/Na+-transporting ATPase subunit alpha
MTVNVADIAAALRQQIEDFEAKVEPVDVGEVAEVGDGIARIAGLRGAVASELLEFPGEGGRETVYGIALNLETDTVGAVILGDFTAIEEGDIVRSTGRVISVPVGDALIGRVVNALGHPIDGRGPIHAGSLRPIERVAPGVTERQNVKEPVMSGILAIDAMIPIGRGQRELIIGDRQTGKTAIAVDMIINQKDSDIVCVYVAIGQKLAQVANLVATLEAHGAMAHTIVVVASASESAALQYIAPYAGCAMGEEFLEQGRHALIVYDDLSKHAWAYRQVSLLLRRPPGREAYPGDVFYLHSRLLERAAKLSDARGGGSLTALPIIETQLSDMSAYIPTNVISITDGQIYLEPDLFYAGIRPAVNAGLSVSRVGGDAQHKAMKQVAGKMRLDMAAFRALAAFAQFGGDLDAATQRQLDQGLRLQEVLKQVQYEPQPFPEQVAAIHAVTRNHADHVAIGSIKRWQEGLIAFLRGTYPGVLRQIAEERQLTEASTALLEEAVEAYNATWLAEAEG